MLIVLALEAVAGLLLNQMLQACNGGDLIRMDTSPYCQNFSQYKDPRASKPEPARCTTGERYDVILLGSSVSQTGWVEALRGQGLNVCWRGRAFFERHGWDIFRQAERLYKTDPEHPSILLFADLTERRGRRWENMFMDENEERVPAPESGWKVESSFLRLWRYLSEKRLRSPDKLPRVEKVLIGNETRLLYRDDLEGAPVRKGDDLGREVLAAHLRRTSERARQKNFLFAVAAFPTEPQMYESVLLQTGVLSAPYERTNLKMLERAASDAGVPFLNIEKALQEPARRELENNHWLWGRDDTHMNALGNQYVGAAMRQFIEEIHSLAAFPENTGP